MKDIVIRERFTFAPNFRKALALHYGQRTVTNEDIRTWIQACVRGVEQDVENEYYNQSRSVKHGT